MGACHPVGCLARCMGNPKVTSGLNLFLDVCSLLILMFATMENFASVTKCLDSYEKEAGRLGKYYGKWIYAGGVLSATLSVVTILEIISDSVLDYCCGDYLDEDAPGLLDCLECAMSWLKTLKKYYMMFTNAGEPVFLVFLTMMAKVGPAMIQYFDAGITVLTEDELKEAKACVDDRYRTIGATGIGAILASIQTGVRTFIDVGKYVHKEVIDSGGDVENYKKAYARASSAFGPVAAAMIMIGYSDEISDMGTIARTLDFPEPAIEAFEYLHENVAE